MVMLLHIFLQYIPTNDKPRVFITVPEPKAVAKDRRQTSELTPNCKNFNKYVLRRMYRAAEIFELTMILGCMRVASNPQR